MRILKGFELTSFIFGLIIATIIFLPIIIIRETVMKPAYLTEKMYAEYMGTLLGRLDSLAVIPSRASATMTIESIESNIASLDSSVNQINRTLKDVYEDVSSSKEGPYYNYKEQAVINKLDEIDASITSIRSQVSLIYNEMDPATDYNSYGNLKKMVLKIYNEMNPRYNYSKYRTNMKSMIFDIWNR